MNRFLLHIALMLCVLQVHVNTWSSPLVRICYPNGLNISICNATL